MEEVKYSKKVLVRDTYNKPDEPWVTFRDIRNIYPKVEDDFREVASAASCNITHWKHI